MRTGTTGRVRFEAVLLIAVGLLVAACGGSGTTSASSGCKTVTTTAAGSTTGAAGSWPYANDDLVNTRDDAGSTISSANVSKLADAWTFKLTGKAAAGVRPYGSLTANPIVANAVVYVQDLDSNVYALALATGKLRWEYQCNQPEKSGPGPNGVAVADGKVYGLTPTAAFALSAATGRTVWANSHLLSEGQGTFGIQPQVANGRVYLASQLGSGPGGGVLLALNASNGALLWRFNTVRGPEPGVQSLGVGSGGAWETPLVSGDGSVTYGIGNPYQTAAAAIAHPAVDLYTDSDVNLGAATGKLRWYYQGVPNDFKDYDMQAAPISARSEGAPVVIGSGKMGYVYEMNGATGKLIWKTPVGEHNGHDDDSLQALEHRSTLRAPFTIAPGPARRRLDRPGRRGQQRVRGDLGRTADVHELEPRNCDQGRRTSDRRGGSAQPLDRQGRMGYEGARATARRGHGVERSRVHHAVQRCADRTEPQHRRGHVSAPIANIDELSDRHRGRHRDRAGGRPRDERPRRRGRPAGRCIHGALGCWLRAERGVALGQLCENLMHARDIAVGIAELFGFGEDLVRHLCRR